MGSRGGGLLLFAPLFPPSSLFSLSFYFSPFLRLSFGFSLLHNHNHHHHHHHHHLFLIIAFSNLLAFASELRPLQVVLRAPNPPLTRVERDNSSCQPLIRKSTQH